jgi:hypothetical protein
VKESLMSVLRTEHDLRVALVELGADAPSVEDVLPSRDDAPHSEPKRARLGGRYLLPAVAVIATLVVAGVIATLPDGRRDQPPAGHDTTQAVGVWWQLVSISGRPVTAQLALQIKPNGRFQQFLGAACESLYGQLEASPTLLKVTHTEHAIGSCLQSPPAPSRTVVSALQNLFEGDLTWSVTGDRLTLHRGGAPTAVYQPEYWSGTPSRQWLYKGVGISVPATWRKNALRCATPIRNTVVYPGLVLSCAHRRPKGVTSVQWYDNDLPNLFPGAKAEPSETQIDGVPATERFIGPADVGPYHGLQVVEVRIPSRNVAVIIASPDPFVEGRLELSLFIPNG